MRFPTTFRHFLRKEVQFFADMRFREQLAAFVLIVGALMVVIGAIMVLPHRSDRYRSREAVQARREQGLRLIQWGAVVGVVGVGVTAVIHLTRRMGWERSYSGTTVLARFVANRQGEVIFEPSVYPPQELRYYVRLRLPDGESDEFECLPALHSRLREGSIGRAVCKGNQLLAFHPHETT